VQERRSGLVGDRGQSGLSSPVAQRRRGAGERQAGLDEQASEFVRRAGVGQVWGQQARRQEKRGFQRRNAM
jgi:hypothetical protein